MPARFRADRHRAVVDELRRQVNIGSPQVAAALGLGDELADGGLLCSVDMRSPSSPDGVDRIDVATIDAGPGPHRTNLYGGHAAGCPLAAERGISTVAAV